MITGTADTGWLDRLVASGGHIPTRDADVALLTAAIDAYNAEEELERRAFYAAAGRGRPQAGHEIGRTVDLGHRGHAYRLAVAQTGPRRYRIEVDGATADVQVEPLRRFARRLVIGEETFTVDSVTDGPDQIVEVGGPRIACRETAEAPCGPPRRHSSWASPWPRETMWKRGRRS